MVTPAPLPSKAAPGGHGDLRLCFLKQTHAGVWDVASFPPTERALGYRGAPGSGLGSRIREEPQDVADGAEPTSSPPGWIQAAPTRGPAGGSPHPGGWGEWLVLPWPPSALPVTLQQHGLDQKGGAGWGPCAPPTQLLLLSSQ